MKDVFKIAKDYQIMIVVEPLANVFAYYNKISGQKFIHINDDLPEYFRTYLIAHMLHYAINTDEEMMFLKEKQSMNFTEAEKAANKFALELIQAKENADKVSEFLSPEEMEELSSRLKRLWGTDNIKWVIEQLEQS